MARAGGVWRGLLAMLALFAGAGGVPSVLAQAAATLPCTLEPGPTRAVAAVLDGETVRLDDGIEVRLIGALTPRATDGGAEGGAAAWPPETEARAALERLVDGRSVALAFAGPRADRYGRVLAHLFVEQASEQVWVQGRLVETGHARAYSLAGSDACIGALLARERGARNTGLGLWSHAAYQVRPADRPTELARYRHTFQVVRGRVERGRGTRGLAILELASGERAAAAEGTSQRGAFRVVWRWAVGRSAALDQPDLWRGRNVVIRGWIEARGGPEIEIMAAGQLENDE